MISKAEAKFLRGFKRLLVGVRADHGGPCGNAQAVNRWRTAWPGCEVCGAVRAKIRVGSLCSPGYAFDIVALDLAHLRSLYRRPRTLFEHQAVACGRGPYRSGSNCHSGVSLRLLCEESHPGTRDRAAGRGSSGAARMIIG